MLPFDKYDLYRKAVQSPEADVEFYQKVYRDLRKKSPRLLREDFCGTFMIAAEWVKLHKQHKAYGVDIDLEPMEYGRDHYQDKLSENQKSRLVVLRKNVLTPGLPKVDISVAVNFSYYVFKSRDLLKRYFQNVYRSLNSKGVFIVDAFGGGQCQDAAEDTHRYPGFTYYWDQTSFDPVSNQGLFYIHFRYRGKKYKKVFTYDWRMWSLPEIRELMTEVGFKKTHIYWEGTNRKGEGNGIFTRTEKGESCLSWIAYVVGEK